MCACLGAAAQAVAAAVASAAEKITTAPETEKQVTSDEEEGCPAKQGRLIS